MDSTEKTWKDANLPSFLKKMDFVALVNFIYGNSTMLTDKTVETMLTAIPKNAPSIDLVKFVKSIVPLLIRAVPVVAQNYLPKWISERAVGFRLSESVKWPSNASNLIDAYFSSLEVPINDAFMTNTGNEVTLSQILADLNNKLKELQHFKAQYSFDVPLR